MKITDIINESMWGKVYKHPVTGKTRKFSNSDMAKKWMSSIPASKPSKSDQLNKIWNAFEQTVANQYPDGDPIDVLMESLDRMYSDEKYGKPDLQDRLDAFEQAYDNLQVALRQVNGDTLADEFMREMNSVWLLLESKLK
jgi:hypothetical protein